METFYRKFTVDNVNAEFFAPAGVVIRGAIGWNVQDVPFASLVFDTIKAESILSVGDRDILPRTVNIAPAPDGAKEGSVEYVFGEDKNLDVLVIRQREESFLRLFFAIRKEVLAYLNVRFTKKGVSIMAYGDPFVVLREIINQTREVNNDDTENAGRVAFATVSD